MIRLVTALLALAAVAAGAAAADGPVGSASTTELSGPGGRVYTTAPGRFRTVVSLSHGRDKSRRAVFDGYLGFAVPTANGGSEGLSHDGGTLVLMAATSRYVVVDAHSLRLRRNVRLQGRFNYDALSPDGRTLFLIQSVTHPAGHYYVRAYDLAHGRLLPQIIFDAREKGEGPMSGTPITRATGPTGRWIYTLYARPGGNLFVHALDSVDRHAFCIDLPDRVSQAKVFRMTMRVKAKKLLVQASWATHPVAVIDTRTLRVRG